MASKMSKSLEDQVTCPICLDKYMDPRILPCLHTYCKGCLEDLLNKGARQFSIQCPECREIVKTEDVNSLKVNIWVKKTLSILELSKDDTELHAGQHGIVCNNCENSLPAETRCLDCEAFCCNFCTKAHERMSILRGHQVITIEEIKKNGIPVKEKPPFCEKHRDEVKKLYCKTCEHLICRDCIVIDHKQHDFFFVNDIVEKSKEEIMKVIQETCVVKEKVKCFMTSVQEMQKHVEKNAMDTEEQIHKQITVLEEKRSILVQDTNKLLSNTMKELKSKEEYFTMHMVTLTSAIEFTENLLTKGSNSDVMSLSKQVVTRLSELSGKPIDKQTAHLHMPRLLVNEKLLKGDIATIDSHSTMFFASEIPPLTPFKFSESEPELQTEACGVSLPRTTPKPEMPESWDDDDIQPFKKKIGMIEKRKKKKMKIRKELIQELED